MEKLFVPYELAVLAKEKGFDEPCAGYYNTNDKKPVLCAFFNYTGVRYASLYKKHQHSSDPIAPLYQQLVDWFRERHDINIVFDLTSEEFCFIIESLKPPEDKWAYGTDYYSALTEALKEAFKLI